jgi:hypothetical protein
MMFRRLPLAWLAGLQLKACNDQECSIMIKHRWVNQNPFRSIYFAAQLMAEMGGGLPSLLHIRSKGYNSAMLVTHIEASFYKKATGRITFRFNEVADIKAAVDEAQRSTEQTATYLATTHAFNESGQKIAEVRALWSFRARPNAAATATPA